MSPWSPSIEFEVNRAREDLIRSTSVSISGGRFGMFSSTNWLIAASTSDWKRFLSSCRRCWSVHQLLRYVDLVCLIPNPNDISSRVNNCLGFFFTISCFVVSRKAGTKGALANRSGEVRPPQPFVNHWRRSMPASGDASTLQRGAISAHPSITPRTRVGAARPKCPGPKNLDPVALFHIDDHSRFGRGRGKGTARRSTPVLCMGWVVS